MPTAPAQSSPVRLERDHGVAFVVIDNPPVNATSHGSARRTMDAVAHARRRSGGAGRSCSPPPAGPSSPAPTSASRASRRDPPLPPGSATRSRIAPSRWSPRSTAPRSAAASRSRSPRTRAIATADARVGLPEVTLGIIPGAGGHAARAAARRHCGGDRSRHLGPAGGGAAGAVARPHRPHRRGDLRAEAHAFARELIGKPLRRTGALPVPPFDRAAVESVDRGDREARARAASPPGRQHARRCSARELDIADGLRRERDIFPAAAWSRIRPRRLRHVFFAEREAAKIPGLEGVTPRPVNDHRHRRRRHDGLGDRRSPARCRLPRDRGRAGRGRGERGRDRIGGALRPRRSSRSA